MLVGVSSEDKATVEGYFQKQPPVSYCIAIDPSREVSAKYPSNGIPNAYVIGADGVELFNGHPMSPEFEAAIMAGAEKATGF